MSDSTTNNHSFSALRTVVLIGIGIMIIKFVAYFLTHSNAILTDALESIINVVAGSFALYSIKLSAKPKDKEHPYGHGKIEFISVGFEGGLVLIAGLALITKSIDNLIHPIFIHDLNIGIVLSAVSGLINYLLGKYLIRVGKLKNSITLVADGKHLLSDTYSSIGLVVGLVLISLTNLLWLDSIIAIVFGLIILITGYKLVRKSLAGLMDEANEDLLNEVIEAFKKNRKTEWIDIHNLRVLQYGANLHIDCHITLPWYNDLQQTHAELKLIEDMIHHEFGDRVELFIHPDPCLPFSCNICAIGDCKVRQHPFQQKVNWELTVLLSNEKHQLQVR